MTTPTTKPTQTQAHGFDHPLGEPPAEPHPSRGPGTTSLRVGVAMVWLSVIVLLPLAAIAWQAAGGAGTPSGLPSRRTPRSSRSG